jgi:hypothetical protein
MLRASDETIVARVGTEPAMIPARLLAAVPTIGAMLLVLGLSTAHASRAPVLLKLDVDSAQLDADELRTAIRRELDCELVSDGAVLHDGELVIALVAASKVSVSFRATRDKEPLTRVVSLPAGKAQRTQWIAWLVGNLARDEAEDWLAAQPHEQPRDTQPSSGSEPTRASVSETGAATEPNSVAKSPIATVSNGVSARPSTENQPALTRTTLNLSVWYKWLQLRPSSAESRFTIHLGAGYGRVGAIRGVGFDGLHHRVDHELQGVGSSLIWTRVPQTQGLAWSAGVITASGRLRGVDLAWVFAYRDALHGNGLGNAGPSPGTNIDTNLDVIGMQLGGFGAWSHGSFTGVQAAGLFTNHRGAMRGVQAALAANVNNDLDGVQIAAMNAAGNVHGLQIGLVNYARRVDGIAVGLINISDNVRAQVLPWVERSYHENIGIRYAYEVLTFGYSGGYDATNDRTRFLLSLGAIFPRRRVAFVPSLNVGFFVQKANAQAVATRGHENDVRFALEWEIVPKVFGVMGGPTLALQSAGEGRMTLVPRWFIGLTLL